MNKYYSEYSVMRFGWCIMLEVGAEPLLREHHAGPFESKALAESEAKRLNDLTEQE